MLTEDKWYHCMERTVLISQPVGRLLNKSKQYAYLNIVTCCTVYGQKYLEAMSTYFCVVFVPKLQWNLNATTHNDILDDSAL